MTSDNLKAQPQAAEHDFKGQGLNSSRQPYHRPTIDTLGHWQVHTMDQTESIAAIGSWTRLA